ncbi:MAG: hypothetical protein DSY42_05615 [Aquifex sp.]|nr:MAG: hypothetical protein DSY42_05615 [Aquifex sp.]
MAKLPPDWWKYERYRKVAPPDYFILPKERKYPYKTHDGKISCTRLFAAQFLARVHKDYTALKKIEKLISEHCRGKK